MANIEQTITDQIETDHPVRALLWVSLLQGACLYFLYGSMEALRWPATDPAWFFPLATLTVIAPLMLLLSVRRENWRAVARDVAVVSTVLSLLAAYVGMQAKPFNGFPISRLTTVYVLTIGIASFKAVIHIQRRAEGAGLSYPSLFTNSWRSFLIGALGALFAVIFYLTLVLWGALFKVIDIDFFQDLFSQEWFVIPSITFSFGVGALLFRRHTQIIDSITSILHSLIKLLLPLIVFVAVVFVSTLPFTGLEPLWDTGNGTALLLWLLAALLFFVNAVYQDGRETDPYSPLLHRAIYLGICTTPVIAALAFYGLLQRLQEYGWTVGRCWAFVTWLTLTLLSLGYVVGIIRRRDAWTEDLARANTFMGLLLMVILFFANSPLLDFRKLSLASQINRVKSGEIELAEFDFYYAKHTLARPGYLYLNQLKVEIGDNDPELLAAAENPVWNATNPVNSKISWERVQRRPADLEVPPALRAAIRKSSVFATEVEPLLLAEDLDSDGVDEYVLVLLWPTNLGAATAILYYQEDDTWRPLNLSVQNPATNVPLLTLMEGEVTLIDQRFKDLDIGGVRLSVTTPYWLSPR
ncbi:MAG: DUF4153 domain-containing protein [Pseudomonadota bacterium]